MSSKRIAGIALLLLALAGAGRASAQQCPRVAADPADTASIARTLTGRLIYHDGIRQWFELKPDRPACGKTSLQLTGRDAILTRLAEFRGCRVASRGVIDFSPTGYYSRDLYQSAVRLVPLGRCTRRPPLPDYSGYRPDKHVRAYTVRMHVDYRPGDHPVVFRVRSGGRELKPWRAYAGYMLTGGFVLYGLCGDGFAVDKVWGTAAARPSHFSEAGSSDDKAMYDPEAAAQSGKTDLYLGYGCIRAR